MPTGKVDFGANILTLQVSILVLLDDAYRLYHNGRTGTINNVSILVLLDDAYRPHEQYWYGKTYPPVSILVLLDDAYRHSIIVSPSPQLVVSILVLLDDAYRQYAPPPSEVLLLRFQSLFFWMMPTGSKLSRSFIGSFSVSILVLLDDAYRLLRSQVGEFPGSVSILVLLDDAYRRSFQDGTGRRFAGFNPCSSG